MLGLRRFEVRRDAEQQSVADVVVLRARAQAKAFTFYWMSSARA